MLKNKHPWHKARGYIHFDLPVSLVQAELIATNPQKVESHAFYPFISYEIISEKVYKKSDDGKIGIKKKIRPVSYASHIDSHIYSYYALMLNKRYEDHVVSAGIDSNVIAFRKLGKSNIHFANQAFDEIIKRQNCSAITFDIEGFFDNLDHSIIKATLCKIINCDKLPNDYYNIYKSLTKYTKADKSALYDRFNISKHNPKAKQMRVCEPKDFRSIVRKEGLLTTNANCFGIPQGSPISALLSNIYMIDFDNIISSFVKNIDGVYLRYCDDILCIIPHASKNEAIDLIKHEVEKLKLTIHKDKTKVSDFNLIRGLLKSDRPLQYLGFTFDGQHKLIRSSALARYSQRMKSGVRLAKLTKIKYNRIRIKNGIAPQELYKRKIYERYSHLGSRNFITYGFRSANIMGSSAIRKQLRPLWKRLHDEINK